MALIHHNGLRVNSDVPEETIPTWRENGWASGLHKDSDPDDEAAVPRVLPAPAPESEAPAAKADTKKKD